VLLLLAGWQCCCCWELPGIWAALLLALRRRWSYPLKQQLGLVWQHVAGRHAWAWQSLALR
jgi:hypothetical protein